jgi:hypothetical protein
MKSSGKIILVALVAFIFGCRTTKQQPVVTQKPAPPKPLEKPIEKPVPVIPQELNLAILLPFDFKKNLSSDTLSVGEISAASLANLHCYEGMMLAIDSLKGGGANIKINVFDSSVDSLSFINLLYKKEVLASDYIICATNANYLTAAATVAKKHQNKIVFVQSPMQNNIIKDNSSAWLALPANYTQSHVMASFLASNYKDANFLIVSRENTREKMWASFFTTEIKSECASKNSLSSVSQINYTANVFDSTNTIISKEKRNVIIIPSSDEAFVSPLLGQLNNLNMANIIIAGLPTWENFESIDFSSHKNLKVLYFSSSFIDENDIAVKNLQKAFFSKYFTLPIHQSFVGFDLMVWLTQQHFGNDFQLKQILPANYVQPFENSGFENIYTPIIGVEEYKLVKKN